MTRINRQTDYAICVLLALAKQSDEALLPDLLPLGAFADLDPSGTGKYTFENCRGKRGRWRKLFLWALSRLKRREKQRKGGPVLGGTSPIIKQILSIILVFI